MIVSKIKVHSDSEPKIKLRGSVISTQKVDVKCDTCGNIRNIFYASAIKQNKKYGKDICKSCIAKLQIKNGTRKTWTTSRNEGLKGKNYEEIFGNKKAREIKKNISKSGVISSPYAGKTYEQIFGNTEAKRLKDNLSKQRKGKKLEDWVKNPEKTKARMSKAASGENNPMFGKPSPKGSGNGWSGWYNGIYFRSLLELSYLKYLIDNNIKFENAEQHKFMIEYVESYSGNKRNYFADFYLIDSQELIEVKPKRLINSKQNKDKFEAAKIVYGDKFKILTEKDVNKLSIENIKELYNNQEIKFLEKYENKFKEKYL